MNKTKYILLCSLIVWMSSCKKEISVGDYSLLTGYWEIEKAKLPDGTEKDYSFNASVDYFEVNEEGIGFRQKLMPQFNGEYLTNDIPEEIKIEQEGSVFWINYKTDFSEWKEQLMTIKKDELILKNEHDIIYYYKRTDAVNSEDAK